MLGLSSQQATKAANLTVLYLCVDSEEELLSDAV